MFARLRVASDRESPAKAGLPGLDAVALDRGVRSWKMSAGGTANARKPSSSVVGVVLETLAPSTYLRVRTNSSLSGMGRSVGVHDAAGEDVRD